MKSAFAFILCVWLAQSAQAQIIGLGKCPNVTAVADFDASAYIGEWFEYSRYFAIFEAGTKCVTANYGATETDGVITVDNVGYRLGFKVSVTGTATASSDDNSGKFIVKFDNQPNESDYWIIGTDYESYAVVWICADAGFVANAQFAWVLTRDRQPTQEVIDAAYAVLTEKNLSTSKLSVVDQSDCEQYESS